MENYAKISKEQIKSWVIMNTYGYQYFKLPGTWGAKISLPNHCYCTVEASIEKIYNVFTELIMTDKTTYNMLCHFLKIP